MSYWENRKKQDEKHVDAEQQELQRLMCSVPGCRKRWTVHLDGSKPMCSEHQWPKSDPKIAKDFNQWAENYVKSGS